MDEPVTVADAAADEAEAARKNMRWGWALFALFCLLFGGTVLVAYAYLWLS
jgi:hypothetical protein